MHTLLHAGLSPHITSLVNRVLVRVLQRQLCQASTTPLLGCTPGALLGRVCFCMDELGSHSTGHNMPAHWAAPCKAMHMQADCDLPQALCVLPLWCGFNRVARGAQAGQCKHKHTAAPDNSTCAPDLGPEPQQSARTSPATQQLVITYPHTSRERPPTSITCPLHASIPIRPPQHAQQTSALGTPEPRAA